MGSQETLQERDIGAEEGTSHPDMRVNHPASRVVSSRPCMQCLTGMLIRFVGSQVLESDACESEDAAPMWGGNVDNHMQMRRHSTDIEYLLGLCIAFLSVQVPCHMFVHASWTRPHNCYLYSLNARLMHPLCLRILDPSFAPLHDFCTHL